MADLAVLFSKMMTRFDAEAAGDTDAVFQYLIDGEAHWNVAVCDGRCEINEGEHSEPSVTLSMDGETLAEVMAGELDGMQAFMEGRIQAEGDIMEATKLTEIFPVG